MESFLCNRDFLKEATRFSQFLFHLFLVHACIKDRMLSVFCFDVNAVDFLEVTDEWT